MELCQSGTDPCRQRSLFEGNSCQVLLLGDTYELLQGHTELRGRPALQRELGQRVRVRRHGRQAPQRVAARRAHALAAVVVHAAPRAAAHPACTVGGTIQQSERFI